MTNREAMQMALDALEYYDGYNGHIDVSEEIEALRTALAQPEKEWVGLTDEEISGCINATVSLDKRQFLLVEFSKFIQAKLKEKNS